MASRFPSISILLVVLFTVSAAEAAPAKKTPPAVDAGTVAPTAAAKDDPASWPTFRVAVMPFSGVNVKPELLTFYTEHFGSALVANGVRVTTPAQIQAVIGLERQKQLLGCAEGESCIAELGNALGVDGIATATIALLDNSYRLNIKIVSAETSELLSATKGSVNLRTQTAVADELSNAAREMSKRAAGRARRSLGTNNPVPVLPPIKEPPKEDPSLVVRAQPDAGTAPSTEAMTSDAGTVTPVEKKAAPKIERQQPPPVSTENVRKNRITVGALGLFLGALPVEYERALGGSFSLYIGGSPVFSFLQGGRNGVRGLLGFRIFPTSKPAPSGFWFGLEAVSEYVIGSAFNVFTFSEANASFAGVNGLLTGGYTFIATSGFTFSAGAGAGVALGVNPDTSADIFLPALSLHLNAGWAF